MLEQHLHDFVHHDIAINVEALSVRLQVRGKLVVYVDDVASLVAGAHVGSVMRSVDANGFQNGCRCLIEHARAFFTNSFPLGRCPQLMAVLAPLCAARIPITAKPRKAVRDVTQRRDLNGPDRAVKVAKLGWKPSLQ